MIKEFAYSCIAGVIIAVLMFACFAIAYML